MRRSLPDAPSSCRGIELLPALRCHHFLQNSIQPARDLPFRIMRLELPQIRDVADVIALARFLYAMPVQLPPGELFDSRNGFQYGDAVAAPAAHVVDLPGARVRGKLFDGPHHVV